MSDILEYQRRVLMHERLTMCTCCTSVSPTTSPPHQQPGALCILSTFCSEYRVVCCVWWVMQLPQKEPEISTHCAEMLMLLGLHIYHDVQLVTDLARVVRFLLLFHLPRCGSGDDSASEQAVDKVWWSAALPGCLQCS